VRRTAYWLGVLLGVALLVSGVVVGAEGYADAASPGGVARAYFAALADGDAAQALAYGSTPLGPRTLLTDTVLREQQRIAPLRNVSVGPTRRHGSTANVTVRYVLRFADEEVPVSTDVPMHRDGGAWRLDYTAIPTEFAMQGADQRATVLGGPVPKSTVLLFPGAVPISFDTAYLELDPVKDTVDFGTSSITDVFIRVTQQARTAALRAATQALRRCISAGAADPACPLPSERYVPGSIHGRIVGSLRNPGLSLDVTNAVGVLNFGATAVVEGSYARLDFHNRRVDATGRIKLDLQADAYAVAPLELRWVTA
jgi:hypothetical protein